MHTGRNQAKRPMSQINVTPLVDVMLVLLIIFMVTTPMMQEGIDVELPKVEAGAVSAADEPLVLTIDAKSRVYIGKRSFKVAELAPKLAAIAESGGHKMVLIRADESVPYGVVMTAMAEVRKAGITKVGMVTEPVER